MTLLVMGGALPAVLWFYWVHKTLSNLVCVDDFLVISALSQEHSNKEILQTKAMKNITN